MFYLRTGTSRFVGGATEDDDHVLGGPTARGWGTGAINAKTQLPSPSPELPLPLPSPVICGLPEFLVRDVADFFSWLGKSHPLPVRLRDAWSRSIPFCAIA